LDLLPDDRKNAIIVPVSHEDTARTELEKTVRRLLEDATASVRQSVAKDDNPLETYVQTSSNTEKTAHDFRVSLNIIIGFTELMLDGVMGKINKEQRSSLNDILSNSKRLLGLSDGILQRLEKISVKND
jgi:signal transduction histidine kinase